MIELVKKFKITPFVPRNTDNDIEELDSTVSENTQQMLELFEY
jgi:hypothetical protein